MGIRRVRGIRATLPQNTVVGRKTGGKGRAEMIDLADLAMDLQTYGAGATAGGGGLPTVASGHILANLTGSTAVPIDKSVSAVLDYVFGSARGLILRRGSASWQALTLGSSGKVLQSDGTDADWATLAAGSIATASDVSESGLANNDLLRYQTSDSKWHNVTVNTIGALITVLGTIATGVWHGTKIALGYGGTGSDLAATGPGFLKQATLGANVTVAYPATTDLSDFNISSLANHDFLWYQTSDSKWHNLTFSAFLDGILGTTAGFTLARGATSWTAAGGASWKKAVAVATAAALAACTYANGTAGVGATLTGNANGAIAVDGITPIAGQRVLVKNQASAFQNGIYDVTQVGTAGTPFILTRSTDWDGSGYMDFADCVAVGVGTANASTIWTVQLTDPVTFGTTVFTWVLIASQNIVTSIQLSAATDASFSGLANNDFMQYQTSDAKWHNRTVTQATAALNAATATLKGLVPTPPNNTTTFFRGDATFATPAPGSGGGLFAPDLSTVPTLAGTGLATWVNQGSATAVDTTEGVFITIDSGHASNICGRKTTSVPGTPYSITILLGFHIRADTSNPFCCIGWTDGTKFHLLETLLVATTGLEVSVVKWTNSTTFSSNESGFPGPRGMGERTMWYQIRDDGTNVQFSIGTSPKSFINCFAVAKASGFLGGSGYSSIFVGGDNAGNGQAMGIEILNWTQGA